MTEKQLREQVVATMRGWLGYDEKNGKHKEIIDIYNSHKPLARGYKVKYTDEWCATAVSAAAIECGLTDIMPTECSCSKMIALHKELGQWQEADSHKPSPGDIIMYDWSDPVGGKGDNKGAPDHTGIVEKVANGVITVIEGNRNEAVARRTIAVNGRYIRGYCLPNFKAKAAQTASKAETKVSPAKSKDASIKSGVRYKVTASVLNVRSSASSKNSSNIIGKLERGDKVVWYGFYTGSFWLVQLPDSSTGYVHKSYLQKV